MTRAGVLAVVVAAAVCLGALAIVSTLGSSEAAPAPPRPLTVSTSVAPHPTFFGDPVTARAEVIVDRRLIDPESVTFDGEFAPYTLVGEPHESRSDSGGATSFGFRFTLSCLDDACLPDRRGEGVDLPPLRVRAALRAGGTAELSAAWPKVPVVARVSAEALAATPPPWRLQLGLAPVSYRVSPSLLVAVLTAGAAALALGAVALVGWEFHRRRRLLAARTLRQSALAEALAFARESAARAPDDRRRALALLARVLAFDTNGGRSLAPAVDHLAWARAEPSPTRLTALVDRVERTVGSA
jgi:hypothetical protein